MKEIYLLEITESPSGRTVISVFFLCHERLLVPIRTLTGGNWEGKRIQSPTGSRDTKVMMSLLFTSIHVFIYCSVFVEDTLQELVLSFHYVGPRD